MDLLLLSSLLVASFLMYMMRNFYFWKKRRVPFIRPVPIFGNILDICRWKTSIGGLCKSIYEQTTEPFIGFFILDEPCLLVNDLDLIKNILIKDFDCFLNRTMANNEKHDGIGSNILFLMKTPNWAHVRRKMTPAFSSGKLKLMLQLMLQGGEQMVEYINNTTKHSKILEAREVCAKFTTNTITSTSFGLEADCFKNEDAPFRIVARRIYNWKMIWHAIQTTCFFIAPKLVKLFRMQFIDTFSSNFFRKVFWEVMNERIDRKFVRNDLLDILIEMRKQDKIDNVESLEGDVLVAQAAQFFIAGFETTSSTMSFELMELARNPEIQDKLRKEIIRTKKLYGSFDYECLQAMKYLENTILETLRLYPIVPFLDRRCTKRYRVPEHDLVLEKGDMVYIPVMGIHYDEKYYPNPKQFDPDRFSRENCEKRHNMTFLPFGDGPRNCIGRRFALLNAKCGLAHLLSNYEVRMCEKTEKDMKLDPKGFLLQPDKGIHLEFVKLSDL